MVLGHEGSGLTNKVMTPFMPLMQSAAMGALPIVRAATDPEARSGQFYGPRWMVRGYPVLETPSRRARRPVGTGSREGTDRPAGGRRVLVRL